MRKGLICIAFLIFTCAVLGFVSAQNIGIDVLYPSGGLSVPRSLFFNVTLNVSCTVGTCGPMTVSLDPIAGSSQSNSNEWTMQAGYLNRTGFNPGTVPGNISDTTLVSMSIPSVQAFSSFPYPIVWNGYVYMNLGGVFQFNASNISQLIANFSLPGGATSTPAISDGYMYVVNHAGNVSYQLNASNVNQQIANFSTPMAGGGNLATIRGSFVVSNKFVYLITPSALYQLNASNFTQQIANSTNSGTSRFGSVAIDNENGYYFAGSSLVQFNASNVSQTYNTIGMGTTFSGAPAHYTYPVVSGGYVYLASEAGGSNSNMTLVQVNATNISIWFANFSISKSFSSSIGIGNGCVYFYVSGNSLVYQVNASNVTKQIANFTTTGLSGANHNPLVTRDSVFIGSYQLNASNISNVITKNSSLNNMIASNGYIYASDGTNLYRFGNVTHPQKTLISNTTGATPFYTNGSNPINISLNQGESQVVTFWVNATGEINSEYTFFAFANVTNNASATNQTSNWFMTIRQSLLGVSLNSPSANASVSSSPVGFEGSFTSEYPLINATVYLWNSTGDLISQTTSDLSGTSSNATTSVTLPYDGNFSWNYLVTDTMHSSFNETNYTLFYTASTSAGGSSGGGSSGGGGGGGTSTIHDIDANSLKEGYSHDLRVGDVYRFNYLGQGHNLTLNSYTPTVAKVTLRSTPTILELVKDVPMLVDLTGDSNPDLKIEYNGLVAGLASIFIQDISTTTIPVESSSTNLETDETATTDNLFKKGISSYVVIIGLIVIVIGVISLVMLKQHKRRRIREGYGITTTRVSFLVF